MGGKEEEKEEEVKEKGITAKWRQEKKKDNLKMKKESGE
jgi:hypothetical protein